MDMLDGLETPEVDFQSILLAAEVVEPSVLSWTPGDRLDGDAECTVLAIMKREEGVLLVLPDAFLPAHMVERGNAGEEGAIFGPSRSFIVLAVLMDGGIVSRTCGDVKVLVVDCLPSVVHHLRRFGAEEEIVYGYDKDSPFAFPCCVDALLPAVRSWLRGSRLGGLLYPQRGGGAPGGRRRALPRRLKAKRPTTTALAAELPFLLPMPVVWLVGHPGKHPTNHGSPRGTTFFWLLRHWQEPETP